MAETLINQTQVSANVFTRSNLKPGINLEFTNVTHKDNFDMVGTVTITNNIASGFSDTNYLTMQDYLLEATSSFEVGSSFVLDSEPTGGNCSIIDKIQIDSTTSFRFEVNLENKIQARFSNVAGSFTYFLTLTGTTVLSLNTHYWAKVTYSSTSGYELLLSTDGTNWVTEATSTDTTLIGKTNNAKLVIGDNFTSGSSFPGSIYLTDTYINVNGSKVWTCRELVNETVISAPDVASFLSGGTAPTSGTNSDMAGQTYVNTTDGSLYVCQALTGGDPTTYYTVVGSPTINSSYVASNFGSSSYVDTGVTFRPSGAWNIKMKFNCSAISSSWYKLTGHTGNGVSIGVDNYRIKLECSSTGSGWDVCAFSGSTSIQLSRDYWIDFGFDGTNTYYVNLSTDGVTYTRDGSATSTKKVYSTATMGLGCAFSGYDSHYFVGSIYLADFEIYEATELTYRAVSLGGPLWKSAAESIKTITGYNASATQVLKNVNGVLTWVDEA